MLINLLIDSAVFNVQWMKRNGSKRLTQEAGKTQIPPRLAASGPVRQLFTIYTFILTDLKRGKISFACLSKCWKISRTGMTRLLGDCSFYVVWKRRGAGRLVR